MKKTKKHIWLAIIAIIIAALAFGYAYLTTTLSINGTTDIDANNWDVYFDNAVVTEGSVTGAQVIEAPTITSDTEVEFHVNLKKPGDFYEFTIEARNDGTIDAMINSVSKKLNNAEVTTLPAYLDYKVTYKYGTSIENNHLLAAESLETYKIRVEFKKNISSTDLPSTAQSLTLSFGVEYVQADENATKVMETIYNSSRTEFIIGETVPTGVTLYDNYDDAMAAIGVPFFLKHTIDSSSGNDIIAETYVGVKINNNVYYIRGNYNDDYSIGGLYYEDNKNILKSAFGEENCEEGTEGGSPGYYYFSCEDPTTGINASTDNVGNATIDNGIYTCGNHVDNTSMCG